MKAAQERLPTGGCSSLQSHLIEHNRKITTTFSVGFYVHGIEQRKKCCLRKWREIFTSPSCWISEHLT